MALIGLALAAMLSAAAPPNGCQAALGPRHEGVDESALPDQIDGSNLTVDALVALRRARGDALIVVRGGNFAGADLRRAQLRNVCFLATRLAGSDWRDAEAPGVGFVRTNLSGADLRGASLQGVLIRNSSMENVNAEGARLDGGRLDGGWFDGSITRFNLDRADLTGFTFDCGIALDDGCPVYQGEPQISLRGANLTGANLFGYDSLEGARIDRTRVKLDQLADLAAAALEGPILLGDGDGAVALTPADYRTLRPHMVSDEQALPSFDCARAATATERFICSEAGMGLRPLDRRLAELYRAAIARHPAERGAQLAWLRERDRCLAAEPDTDCLEQSYRRRIAMLAGRAGPPDWLRPGTFHLFVEPTIRLDEAFRAHPLYRRLVPVIRDQSWAGVSIRVDADGALDATGEAIGANAHSCTLDASGLRLDPATGWYSAWPAEGPMRGRPVPVLLVRGDWIEVYASGHADGSDPVGLAALDYASCGARAGFGDMIRVPVAPAEAERRFRQTGESR